MDRFRRVLAAVDLSYMDEFLMQGIESLASAFSVEKAYFVHIIPDLNMPGNAEVEFQKLFAPEIPVDEQIKSRLANDLQPLTEKEPDTEFSVEVIEGKPYKKLLHWLQVKDIDLLVVGLKNRSAGSGITAKRVARQVHASVLFVPERGAAVPKHILVPTDFSKDSANALKTALRWKNAVPQIQITVLHVTDLIAAGYNLNQREFENFNKFLQEAAEDSFTEFLEKHHLPKEKIHTAIVQNETGKLTDRIHYFVQENNIDWVIMGAQGHSALERFFFGSITEQFLDQNNLKSPVLVVRE